MKIDDKVDQFFIHLSESTGCVVGQRVLQVKSSMCPGRDMNSDENKNPNKKPTLEKRRSNPRSHDSVTF